MECKDSLPVRLPHTDRMEEENRTSFYT